MGSLVPFALEDFFYEFEHRPGGINLASSDVKPWKQPKFNAKRPWKAAKDELRNWAYPNVEQTATRLKHALEVPADAHLEVLPTTGAAEAIWLVLQALAIDERLKTHTIAIPEPAFGAYHGVSQLLGFRAQTYRYRQSARWSLDESQLLEAARVCNTVIVNTPHNPTGDVFRAELITQLMAVIETSGATLVVDEIFSIPDEPTFPLHPQVVRLSSLSKIYGLPGVRFGWVIAHRNLYARMKTIQQYCTLSLNRVAAAVGPVVVEHGGDFRREKLLLRNRKMLLEWAADHGEHVTISHPAGGTTAVLELAATIGERDFFDRLQKARTPVLLVPGSKFPDRSSRTWFRLGYGGGSTQLRRGLDELISVVEAI
jgi:aspartate/methionine/tyrosine aminotransferase